MIVSTEEQANATALISRYARSADAGDADGVVACFTDDVVLSLNGGALVMNNRTEASDFYHRTVKGFSTHLLANYGFERVGSALVVNCSAVAFLCRKEGVVTMKGLAYAFECVGSEADLRIRKVNHSAQWECEAAGGPNLAAA